MTTFVLDTGMVLGYVRGAAYAQYADARFGVSTLPNVAVVSVVTVGEIQSLALQLGWGQDKLRKLGDVLRKLPTVDIGSSEVLDRYAAIDAYSQGKHPSRRLPPGVTSRNMGKNDIWIAATASVLQATLLTTDGHFDHLNGRFLQVEYIDQTLRGGGSP